MKNLLLSLLVISTTFLEAQNPLFIPSTITGTSINLILDTGTTQFYPGRNTKTMGANGILLAPTIIMERDSFVNITVDNQLPDTTTMHWHGLHVSPENDGGPHSIIPPNTIWNPQFTVMDKAGTFWYHPHLHHHTDKHVSMGIAGLLLVRDAEEASLNLPMTYGVDEFPIIFQTKGLDSLDQIEVHTEMDTVVMVNGTLDATVDFPAQIVRLRVLNGSSQRVLEFGFSDNRSFSLIGTDGGLLSAPVSLTRYRMGPGQRADILVDLSSSLGQNFKLMSFGSGLPNGHYGATAPGIQTWQLIPGYPDNPLNGSNIQLLDIDVVAQTSSPILTIPTTLANFTPLAASSADLTRSITFTVAPGAPDLGGPFLMNDTTFVHGFVNDTVLLGATEIWSLNNHTGIAHPFHIHDVQFFILSQNGAPPPPELQGYHDVVLVPGNFSNVQFIAKFEDFASDTVPYMYHCHMLPHEDMGMMGQFLVLETVGIDDINTNWDNLSIYPNPTEGNITIDGLKDLKTIKILSIDGKLIKKTDVSNSVSTKIDMPTTKGIYLLEIISTDGNKTIRKIIHY
ncbi:MAG: bilirubin oxidase [Flavobacteriales bacterium]|nr:MAG: bilirubin oxidase [Flavobacteriales bacterium]